MIIGHALKFQWAFMLDDSLRRKSPTKVAVPKEAVGASTPSKSNYSFENETVLFGVNKMERVVTALCELNNSDFVGVLAFPRARGDSFFDRPDVSLGNCQNFQCLHLKMLLHKGVNFRRGMFKAEDMLFSQDCCDRKLGCFLLNRVVHDKHTTATKAVKTSGAHSLTQACVSPENRLGDPYKITFNSPVAEASEAKSDDDDESTDGLTGALAGVAVDSK